MIDANSDTWRAIAEKLEAERESAISKLINDKDSDKQRGKLELIKSILNLKDPRVIPPADQDNYR